MQTQLNITASPLAHAERIAELGVDEAQRALVAATAAAKFSSNPDQAMAIVQLRTRELVRRRHGLLSLRVMSAVAGREDHA